MTCSPATSAKARTRAVAPSARQSRPLTYLSPAETAADAFAPVALDRLRAIKRRHDPDGLFRGNFPVAG